METYLDEKSFASLIEFLHNTNSDAIIIIVAHRKFKADTRVKVLDFDNHVL